MTRGEQRELLDRVHARDAGEADIDQHDVGSHVEHELDRVLGVSGLADELEPARGQHLPQRAADQPLVVDQRDRDRPRTLRIRVLLEWHLRYLARGPRDAIY